MICRRRANYKLNLLPRPLQIVQKLNFRMIRSVTIYDKVRVVSNRVWFYDICTNTIKQITQICYKLIAGATISGGETCGCVFAIVPAITMTNRYGGKIQNSIKKNIQSSQNFTVWSSLLPTDIVEIWKTIIQQKHPESRNCNAVKVSGTQKYEICNKKTMNAILDSSVWAEIKPFQVTLTLIFEWCWTMKKLTNQSLLTTWFA